MADMENVVNSFTDEQRDALLKTLNEKMDKRGVNEESKETVKDAAQAIRDYEERKSKERAQGEINKFLSNDVNLENILRSFDGNDERKDFQKSLENGNVKIDNLKLMAKMGSIKSKIESPPKEEKVKEEKKEEKREDADLGEVNTQTASAKKAEEKKAPEDEISHEGFAKFMMQKRSVLQNSNHPDFPKEYEKLSKYAHDLHEKGEKEGNVRFPLGLFDMNDEVFVGSLEEKRQFNEVGRTWGFARQQESVKTK